jgi:putative effector of murein hydrolase
VVSLAVKPLFWAAVTIGFYFLAVAINRRHCRWWTSPLLVTWALCFALALLTHTKYSDYMRGAHWLLTMLGPAIVAFAMPIYEQRRFIRQYWPVLIPGVTVGLTTALCTSWMLTSAFGLPTSFQRSMLPLSVTTPFALEFVRNVGGGKPEVTAICVALTGLFGSFLGELLLHWLPVRSAFTRGSVLGMGAHAVGTAKAHQIGAVEGSVASMTMTLTGILSVLVGLILALCGR